MPREEVLCGSDKTGRDERDRRVPCGSFVPLGVTA